LNKRDEVEQKKAATEQKYRAVLEEQARDGFSLGEAAARVGVKPVTLAWWRCEIARRDRERQSPRTEANSPALLPVRVRDVEPVEWAIRPATSTPYEVLLVSGRVLRVPRDFEPAGVQALVRAVESASC
jgi:hypothetical protein